MKKNISLLFILLTLTFSSFAQSIEEKNAKLYGNKVLYTVKKNDLEGFKKLAVTLPDWEKMMAQQSKLAKEEKQKIMAQGKEDILQYHEKKSFDRMQKTAKREFIVWDQIKIDDMTCAIEKKGTIQYMSFTIFFHFEQRAYSFSAVDCVKTATGWKMTKGADLKFLTK